MKAKFEIALYLMIAILLATRLVALPFGPPRAVVLAGVACCVVVLVFLRFQNDG